MIKVGLTGGIGSGKSVVASIFEALGVPVYLADIEAKKILDSDQVNLKIASLFGKEVITKDGRINRKALAAIVFNDKVNLEQLNSIIHPEVRIHFQDWCLARNEHPYIIQEAAIIFESGFNSYFDKVIMVKASTETCIERVMLRDQISREDVIRRMQNQWPADKVEAASDIVILNDLDTMVLPQVLKIHKLLLS